MRRRSIFPASIRGRFILVVLFAAVVPLALLGIRLTRSVVRAGEELLRSELEQSLERVAAGVESRWSYRSGELELLANNEVAQRLLASAPSPALAPEDAEYLDQLVVSLARTISSFEYRDEAGRVRWSSPPPPIDTTDARGQPVTASISSPTMTVRLPIGGSGGGSARGELIARVDLPTLLALDASLRLPIGAQLQLVERATGRSLLPAFAPDSLIGRDRFTVEGADWLAVHRSLASPEVTMTMAAPVGAYVEPFERAAREGVITLGLVAVLALLMSAWLTARLTASIERLAGAADAVAGGDLDHRVDGQGVGEVGRLAAAFNSMTESLRRTLGELSKREALAAVGQYAATLAHEVRNGLTAVRVDLQRAEEETTEGAPSGALIARALENVKRLDGTVTGSLRIARGGRNPRRRLDLIRVAVAAAQSADGTFAERGATLVPPTTPATPAWVLGDAIALQQVFLNLLLNSAQAMGPGGRATIAVGIDGSEVRVLVEDNGTGMTPEVLEQVLDPFFSTKAEGTGLGLAIARQVAAAHGGSLRIESKPGEGTRVEVRLPLAAAPSQLS